MRQFSLSYQRQYNRLAWNLLGGGKSLIFKLLDKSDIILPKHILLVDLRAGWDFVRSHFSVPLFSCAIPTSNSNSIII